MKRLCPGCSKRRAPHLFPPRTRVCELCKVAKANGLKRERKEESRTTWIKRCDKVVGEQVRSRNYCESPREHFCKQNWQWCHGISRSYHMTRWMGQNGFCMCAGEHFYFTNHPLEWDKFLEDHWGEETYREMKKLALTKSTIDYKLLYKELSGTLVE